MKDCAKPSCGQVSLYEHYKIFRLTCIQIASELIQLSFGRHSIRPSMSAAIRNTYLRDPAALCSSLWLTDLITEITNATSNISDREFAADNAVAKAYNEMFPGRSISTVLAAMLCMLTAARNHYELYYGKPDSYALVYLYDMMGRADANESVQADFVQNIRDKLVEPWTHNFAGMRLFPEWKKVFI